MPQKQQQTNSGTWLIDNTPIKESWRDFRLVFSWDWNSISVYTWGNTGRCTIGLASHHASMSWIKSATKKATLANFCSATIGHKNIGFWSKEPQCIQNNYKPIDLFIFTVTVIRNWVRITVYILKDVEVPFYCSSKLVWTGLLAVCEDQLAPYTQNIQEGIQNFQEIFLKVVLMYTANVSPVKSTGLPRVTGGTP